MAKRTFHFAAISKITLEHEEGKPTSQLRSNDLRLEVSGNLDKSMYVDGRGLPRKDALKPISNALVLGLVTNIRLGGAKGWWKEGEHMHYVIDQLHRAFVEVGSDPFEGEMEY